MSDSEASGFSGDDIPMPSMDKLSKTPHINVLSVVTRGVQYFLIGLMVFLYWYSGYKMTISLGVILGVYTSWLFFSRQLIRWFIITLLYRAPPPTPTPRVPKEPHK
jgi:hypothetical protein